MLWSWQWNARLPQQIGAYANDTGRTLSTSEQDASKLSQEAARRALNDEGWLGNKDASRTQKPYGLDTLPADFDWQTYIMYNPDLRTHGILSETAARQHFVESGQHEGRPHKRLRVIMRYTACTGLINQ